MQEETNYNISLNSKSANNGASNRNIKHNSDSVNDNNNYHTKHVKEIEHRQLDDDTIGSSTVTYDMLMPKNAHAHEKCSQ